MQWNYSARHVTVDELIEKQKEEALIDTCRGGSNEGEKIYEIANTIIKWPTSQQVAMAKSMPGCYWHMK